MPSKPIFTSTSSVTPVEAHSSISEALIRREALEMEGCSGPTPWQKALKPPPVPVVSTIGVAKRVEAPNCSATVVENGATVDDPTIRIRSAWPSGGGGGTGSPSKAWRLPSPQAARARMPSDDSRFFSRMGTSSGGES